MTRLSFLLLGGLAAAGAAFPQGPGAPAAIARSPQIELKGRIERVQLARGQGTPSLVVKSGDASIRVFLGSMRYLMEQNFNPKAGADVVVKGYRLRDDVYATRISLPAENKVLQLRDDNGRPLWQRGRYGRRR